MLRNTLDIVNCFLDEQLSEYSPSSIMWITVGSMLFIQGGLKAYELYKHSDFDHIKNRVTDYAVLTVLGIPGIGKQVEAYLDTQIHKALDSLKKEIQGFDETCERLPAQLPYAGKSSDSILATFKTLPTNEKDYKKSGAVYTHIDKELESLLSKVSVLTNYTNPMHEHWRYLNRLQGSVIDMCKKLFNAPEGTYGIITHGGTTSILESCKSYVLHARNVLFISNPEIIVPASAHPAFAKAAEMLNATLRIAPVNEKTGQVDLNAVKNLINNWTCLIVGSAPSYPYGQFDNIVALGQLALQHRKPLHVDGCLGGFLNAFTKQAGFQIPLWDFSVPGVTSISADIHKYGYSPKGCSLVFFHPSCKASPTYTNLTSTCGMYVTEGIDGSRSGQPIAEAYTVLMYYGEDRYVEETKKIFSTRTKLVKAINQIDGLRVMYDAPHAVIGIKSNGKLNLSIVVDQFQKKGWSVNSLPTATGMAFHFCITAVHANSLEFVNDFINDITTSVTYAKENPNAIVSGMVKAYGQLATEFAPECVKNLIGGFFTKIRTMHDPIPGFDVPRLGNRSY